MYIIQDNSVNKLIITTGPSFSDPLMNSEQVDYYANINIINQFSKYLKEETKNKVVDSEDDNNRVDSDDDNKVDSDHDDNVSKIVSFKKEKLNLSQWVRLDDVIMGGK